MRICDPMLPVIAADFGVPTSAAAGVVTTYTIGYGFAQLVHGPLGDRFGKGRYIAGAAVAAAPPGRARLHAYVETTIRMAADGKHDLATELQQAELSPKSFDAVMQMHDTLTTPLQNVLADLGLPADPALSTLVQGVITAGMQLVAHGMTVEATVEAVTRLLDDGVPAPS